MIYKDYELIVAENSKLKLTFCVDKGKFTQTIASGLIYPIPKKIKWENIKKEHIVDEGVMKFDIFALDQNECIDKTVNHEHMTTILTYCLLDGKYFNTLVCESTNEMCYAYKIDHIYGETFVRDGIKRMYRNLSYDNKVNHD